MAGKSADSVEAVQGTADDALRCKRCALPLLSRASHACLRRDFRDRSLIKQGYLPEFSSNGENARAQSPLTNRCELLCIAVATLQFQG